MFEVGRKKWRVKLKSLKRKKLRERKKGKTERKKMRKNDKIE
jgi:hypothetical protein